MPTGYADPAAHSQYMAASSYPGAAYGGAAYGAAAYGGAAYPDPAVQADIERRRQEDELKRKREDEEQRREEEARRKQEEEQAAKTIRTALLKLKVPTIETFDALKSELQQVMMRDLAKTNFNQRKKLVEERDQVVAMAEKTVAMLKVQRQLAQEKLREKDKLAQSLAKDMGAMVAMAEVTFQKLKEAAKVFESPEGFGDAEVLLHGEALEAVAVKAEESAQVCLNFLMERGESIHSVCSAHMGLEPKKDEPTEAVRTLTLRVQELCAETEFIIAWVRELCRKVNQKKVAGKVSDDIKALFAMYDKDKDGLLSRKEVLSYAKSEFGFVMNEQALDAFWLSVLQDPSAKGVAFEHFQRLKVAVGIAREMDRDRVRLAESAEREKVIAPMRKLWQEKLDPVIETALEQDKVLIKIEQSIISFQLKIGTAIKSEVLEAMAEIEVKVQERRVAAEALRSSIDEIVAAVEVGYKKYVQDFIEDHGKQLMLRLGTLGPRLERLEKLMASFKEKANTLPETWEEAMED